MEEKVEMFGKSTSGRSLLGLEVSVDKGMVYVEDTFS